MLYAERSLRQPGFAPQQGQAFLMHMGQATQTKHSSHNSSAIRGAACDQLAPCPCHTRTQRGRFFNAKCTRQQIEANCATPWQMLSHRQIESPKCLQRLLMLELMAFLGRVAPGDNVHAVYSLERNGCKTASGPNVVLQPLRSIESGPKGH